jgi:hypothetical protein
VIIAFHDLARVSDTDRYRSGLPVVVVFPKRGTSLLGTSVTQKLKTAY